MDMVLGPYGVTATTEVVRPALLKTVIKCSGCGWSQEYEHEQAQGVAWGNCVVECPSCGPKHRAAEMVKALRDNRDGVRTHFDALMRG